jgi:hypothetical protein
MPRYRCEPETGMESLTDIFADHLEPDIRQFETNAALWRLEIDRHAYRLRENEAIGVEDSIASDAAKVGLEGVNFEIDRLQSFARTHQGMPDAIILRLAEAGVALESARRRLERVLRVDG